MKKKTGFLLILVFLLSLSTCALADSDSVWNSVDQLDRYNSISEIPFSKTDKEALRNSIIDLRKNPTAKGVPLSKEEAPYLTLEVFSQLKDRDKITGILDKQSLFAFDGSVHHVLFRFKPKGYAIYNLDKLYVVESSTTADHGYYTDPEKTYYYYGNKGYFEKVENGYREMIQGEVIDSASVSQALGNQAEHEVSFMLDPKAEATLASLAFGDRFEVKRISGTSRIDTAVAISKETYTSAERVIVTNGYNYPDALTGGVLAEVAKAPILLTAPKDLPDVVLKEIQRLSPKKIYILGGEKAVSVQVEAQLKKLATVERIYGQSRYETARAIRQEVLSFVKTDQTGCATGRGFADALSAAAYSAKTGTPMILDEGKQDIPITTIFGGPKVISGYPEAERIAGISRIDTAIAVAKKGFATSKNLIVTNGWTYPDALAAVSLSLKYDAPILLSASSELSRKVLSYAMAQGVEKVFIVGGEKAISLSAEKEMSNLYTSAYRDYFTIWKGENPSPQR